MRRALPALVLLLAGCGSTPGTIAFTSTRDGNAEVYVMRADGSHVRNLTHNLAQDGQPSWAPDGQRIAFVSARPGNTQIFVMNADGSGQKRLTHSNDGDTAPVWSPDGRKIAFMCTVATPFLVTSICVVNADGSGQRKLTPLRERDSLWPTWSGDSRTILFTRSFRGYLVFAVNTDGTGEREFLHDPDGDAEPMYAPDGATFAYLKATGKRNTWNLYIGSRQLAAGNIDSPVWSPDGKQIAFSNRLSAMRSDLFVIKANGTGKKQRLTASPGTSLSPRWSPNGKSIAFERLRGNSSQVFTVHVDGSGEKQLTREGKNGGPVWRP